MTKKKPKHSTHNNYNEANNIQKKLDDDLREKKREIEFQVVNACMMGNLEVIDEFVDGKTNFITFI